QVEYSFDGNKILFYFTANGRVDFRELVKDLASVFRTRIELRQVGVRDEAKLMGGLCVCGRPLCCSTFLSDFQPVSIKMAKEQNLSLNPTKISGTCGRLMCCLKYEQDAYEAMNKITPPVGALVKTPRGNGIVMSSSLLQGLVKIRLNGDDEDTLVTYAVDEVKLLKKPRRADKADEIELEELKNLEG
ncbi:MAG: regulatory iron-sulfur-containing complex subunit RicT, partial [Clostridia bacterium]|nr:regulatory iron-sulfur-containing complex subunit RicT [Clostridia bacterium]